ncbi:hypothetical protein LEP1GSC100_4280 [Leptospira interrogans serovar Bataviae str. UI 08561]|nr:hypothetical protein LEP1GSC100_4280 [Leptospira interrogans serovar Bataviae str. UI 08561]
MDLSQNILQSNCSIVVAGAMNPNIHHPFWYRYHELISDDFYKQALNPSLIVSPAISQINFADLHIICEQTRWTIIIDSYKKIDEIVNIAGKVFALLSETPLSVFGINFQVHLKTKYDNASAEISKLLSDFQRKISPEISDSASITLNNQFEKYLRNLVIQQSALQSNCLFVSSNFHFDIVKLLGNEKVKFELRDLIDPYVHKCEQDTIEIIKNILMKL